MLHIHLFGHLRLFEDTRRLKFSGLPKTLPLFAYLLLHRSQPLSRDTLAYTLWPDVPEAEARANLRRHLHDLRKALAADGADQPWLLVDTRTVQWNPEAPAWLDTFEFERLSREAHHQAEAIALYTGDLLANLYDAWLEPERERLRQLYLVTLTRLMERYRDRHDYLQAIAYAQQIMNHDPLREDAARDLIALRHASGDRAGAIQSYQTFARRLQDELGATPMPETIALYQTLLQQSGPLKPVPIRPAVTVSAASTLKPRTNQWPAPLTRLIGREAELAEVRRLIASPDSGARLLTITGPGGVGKTRLTLELLTRLLAETPAPFPDGLFFILLSALADPALLRPTIGEALGLGEASLSHLVDFLQPKRLLLVLDNFEQLSPAAGQVADLLAAAPGLHVIVTSRTVLHLYGEQEFPLAPLPLPDLAQLPPPGELKDYPTVALFVERSRAANHAFTLTEANAPAIAEICVRLDGLPLAIELAAARSKVLTPSALLARLNTSLALLTSVDRNRPAQQQTLRATIDWSYNLLEAAEQRLFAQLSVFLNGWTLDAVEAMTNGPAVMEGLLSLVDKSMVRRVTTAEGDARFRMLLTLREYAQERLAASGERAQWCERHARYYLALADRAHREFRGPRQTDSLRQLDNEHDNLRVALAWAVESGNVELALRLAGALAHFWEVRGHIAEGQHWLKQILALPDQPTSAIRADGLLAAGQMAFRQGDPSTAETCFRESLALWRTIGDELGTARALNALGKSLVEPGRIAEAQQLLEESLRLFRQLGDLAGESDVLNNLGTRAYYRGDYAKARDFDEQSLALRRRSGDLRSVANSLNNLGVVDLALGDYAAAHARHSENLAIRRSLGLRPGIAQSLHNLGTVIGLMGDHTSASQHYQEALAIHWELGIKGGLVEGLEGLAWMASKQGQPERAARLFGAADALRAASKFSRDPMYQAEHDQAIAATQTQLTGPVFMAAYQAGQSLPLSQAVALALEKPPPADAFRTLEL